MKPIFVPIRFSRVLLIVATVFSIGLLASCSPQRNSKIVYELNKNFDNFELLKVEDARHWKVIDGNMVFAAAPGNAAWKRATLPVHVKDYQIDAVIMVDNARPGDIKKFFAADGDLKVTEDASLDDSAGIIFRKNTGSMRMAIFYVSKPCAGWAASGALCENDRYLTEIFRFSGKDSFKALSLDNRKGIHHLRVIAKGNTANFYVDGQLCCIMDISSFSGNEVGFCARYQMTFLSFKVSTLTSGTKIYEQRPAPDLLAELGQGRVCPAKVKWQDVMADAAKKIDKAIADGSPDVPGMEHLPNYVYRCVTWMPAGQTFFAYPALHHAIIMNGLLEYLDYTGDKKYLDLAVQLADWNIAHSTPANCQLPYLPYSTTMNGKMGGYVDGNTVMLDKAGYMGSTYLRLYTLTGNLQYKQAALRMAETLLKSQLPNGRWQARVDWNTGSVTQDYTSNQIFNIRFMDQLYKDTGDTRFAQSSHTALQWVLQNPVKTWRWIGFYEDVQPETESVGNWDAIETARYLIAHRSENPKYLEIAQEINDWIASAYCIRQNNLWPMVAEQSLCLYAMNGTTMLYAALLIDLYKATGDRYYRDAAISATNAGLSTSYEGWYSMIISPAVRGLPLIRELDIE